MTERDPSLALRRALSASGPAFRVRHVASRPWASVTFVGARHSLQVDMADGDAAQTWLAALPEADLPIPGEVLIDIVVARAVREEGRLLVTLEALVLDDPA